MFKKIVSAFVLVAGVGFATAGAQAATLELVWEDGVTGSQLNGANNVDLGTSGLYNVRFVESSYNKLFGTTGMDFSTLEQARYAHKAIADQVLKVAAYPRIADYVGGPGFNALPGWYNGTQILTPYALIENGWSAANLYVHLDVIMSPYLLSQNHNEPKQCVGYKPDTCLELEQEDYPGLVFADWERVSAVPLPPSILMFAPALLGIGAIARRRKKQLQA